MGVHQHHILHIIIICTIIIECIIRRHMSVLSLYNMYHRVHSVTCIIIIYHIIVHTLRCISMYILFTHFTLTVCTWLVHTTVHIHLYIYFYTSLYIYRNITILVHTKILVHSSVSYLSINIPCQCIVEDPKKFKRLLATVKINSNLDCKRKDFHKLGSL